MSDVEPTDVDQATDTPEAPVVDPATAEATALLERIRATPAGEPTGATAMQVGKAMCAAAQMDPHKPAVLDDDGARSVRRVLGMADGATVSNLDRCVAEVQHTRASERWQQLDERAKAERWATDFSRRPNSDRDTWLAGRPMFDPTYQPPTFGVRPGMSPAPEPSYSGAAMDAALREAAIAARRQVREVEIVTPNG